MPSFEEFVVEKIVGRREGVTRALGFRTFPERGEGLERLMALTELVGDIEPGDRVVANTTAVALGLGSGGWHFVHWNLERRSLEREVPGHLMKLRYTSLQRNVELWHEKPEHTGKAKKAPDGPVDLLALKNLLLGTPVIVCSLHSQVAVVVAALRLLRPDIATGYVMTDAAALGYAMSDLLAALEQELTGIVSVGHCFGAPHEALTVASGLEFCVSAVRCKVVVVGMGPGVAGTGTALDTTALECASVIDIAGALGARPILALRASGADGRSRHRGVSHHSLTVLSLTHERTLVGVVDELDLKNLGEISGVDLKTVEIPNVGEVDEWLSSRGVRLTSMGRPLGEDFEFFASSAAAAAVAIDSIRL